MSGIIFPILGGGTITSGFGSRTAPLPGASTYHPGVDIAAPAGSTVVAPTDLNITYAGYKGNNGNLIQGVDASGNTYSFAHLSSIGVSPGDTIAAGSPIGAVGSTGNSTGNHLHFGIRDASGNLVNPTDLLNNALNLGKSVLNSTMQALGKGLSAPGNALEKIPGIGNIYSATKNGLGLGGKSLLQQFIDWINQTEFFKRTALIVLAIVLIGIAFIMLNSGTVKKTIMEMAKTGA